MNNDMTRGPLLAMEFGLAHQPVGGAAGKATYATTLDMIEWADQVGFERVALGEYHQSSFGHLPSPLVFAAAVGARTKSIRIRLSVLVALLFDPPRLAEEVAVADLCCGGRLELGLGVGEVEDDYAMFGKSYRGRGKDLDALIPFLRKAWTGEPFEYGGRTIRITPKPCQDPMPIYIGAASRPGVERAVLLADGFFDPAMQDPWDLYRELSLHHGKADPGEWARRGPMFLWVTTNDKTREWERLEPYIRRQIDFYDVSPAGEKRDRNVFAPADDLDDLSQGGAYQILNPDEAIELARELGPKGELHLSPTLGGIPSEDGWEMLKTFEREVLPFLR